MVKGDKVTIIGPAMYHNAVGYKVQVDWDIDNRKLQVRVFDAAEQAGL
jgi:hypothetical protein